MIGRTGCYLISVLALALTTAASLRGGYRWDISTLSDREWEVSVKFVEGEEEQLEGGEVVRWVIVPPGEIPTVTDLRWVGQGLGSEAVSKLTEELTASLDLGIGSDHSLVLEDLFPTQPVITGEPLYFRGYYLAPVICPPYFFDRSRGEVVEVERVSARLSLRSDPYPSQRPIDRPGSDVARLIEAITLNPPTRDPVAQVDHIGRILILYPQNIPQQARVYLDSLALWKRQLGYRVDLLGADPQGDLVQLRAQIRRNYWDVEEPISYLLLVGSNLPQDAIYWPFFRQGANEGDHFWGLMQDTNRFVPDVAVGRLLATSISELQGVVKRSIMYEREPYLDDPTQGEWVRRAIYTAENIAVQGGQFVPSMVHLGRWIITRFHRLGYTRTDTLYASDDASMRRIEQTVRDRLENSGVGLLLSRGWLTGCIVDRERERTANTGRRHPFTAAITCLSFETQKLFFRVTTANNPRGPIGAVAIAGLTNTKYNNSFLGGMIRGLVHYGLTQPGWLINFGKWQVRSDYRLAPELDEDVLRVLGTSLLLGDPSVRLLLPDLHVVQARFPSTLTPYSTGFELSLTDTAGVPIEGAIVCLSQGENLHLVSFTDRGGVARFSFPQGAIREGSLTLTVSGDRLVPRVYSLNVARPNFDIALQAVEFDNPDGRFSAGEILEGEMVIRNEGEEASPQGSIVISVNHTGVTFTEDTLALPPLNAGAVTRIPFRMIIGIGVRFGEEVRVGLAIRAGGVSFPHSFTFSVSRPQPIITLLELAQGGGWNRGSQVEFRPVIANRGDEVLPAATLSLVSSHPEWVAVERGELNMGAIEPQRNGTPNGYFLISIANYAIPGNTLPLLLVITADQGESGAYVDTLSINEVIGPQGIDQPVGPDEYGYICFDSQDRSWDKSPTFAWREINPLVDGYEFEGERLGVEDNGNNQDTSVVVALPFRFRYYGHDFDRLVICSNGWVAFGDENSMFIDFRNYPIPGVQGPDAQLAVFWDDLVNYGGQRSSGVFTYHIEEEGIYVVEWSGMEVYSDPDHHRQEFQLLLYDPDRWPTRTGDGEIKFQYKRIVPVRGDATDNYYSTVGIKNLDNSGGVQYVYWGRYHPNAAPLTDSLAILFTTDDRLQVGSLWGRVILRSDTTQPVVGARVVSSTGVSATTDNQGIFTMDRVPQGSHALHITYPGLSEERVNFRVRAGEETRLIIRLGRPVVEVPERTIEVALRPGGYQTTRNITVRNPGDGALRFRLRRTYPDGSPIEYPHRLTLDLSGETGDGLLGGVEMIDGRLFVSGSGSVETNEDNTIYVLNRQGQEVRRFSQYTQDLFGFRDLAWDGRYLWGGDRRGNSLYVLAIDTTGELRGEYRLSEVGLSPNDPTEAYALTWNDEGDRLYLTFGDKDIVELGWAADTLRVLRRFRMALPGVTLDLRGLAWNPCDEDGMPLYGLSQSGSGDNRRALLVKCNPYQGGTRAIRQLALTFSENGTGLTINFDWELGRGHLAYVADDRRADSLRIYEVGPDSRFLTYNLNYHEVPPGGELSVPLWFTSLNLARDRSYRVGLKMEHNASQDPLLIDVVLHIDPTAGVGGMSGELPVGFEIMGFYPQPFNSQGYLAFSLSQPSPLRADIYDLQGRLVKEIFNGTLGVGYHRLSVDGADLPSGIYLLTLRSASGAVTRKILLVR